MNPLLYWFLVGTAAIAATVAIVVCAIALKYMHNIDREVSKCDSIIADIKSRMGR